MEKFKALLMLLLAAAFGLAERGLVSAEKQGNPNEETAAGWFRDGMDG